MSASELTAGSAPQLVADARRVRALAHPVRLALLDALALYGRLTATEAGERIGESATTCSFHLRQLARYGFVVDAGEPGRRERPWRLADAEVSMRRDGGGGRLFASAALESLVQSRALRRWDEWRRRAAEFPDQWSQHAPLRSWLVHMSPAELAGFDRQVREYLAVFISREQHPDDALPVQVTTYAHPVVEVGGVGTGHSGRAEP